MRKMSDYWINVNRKPTGFRGRLTVFWNNTALVIWDIQLRNRPLVLHPGKLGLYLKWCMAVHSITKHFFSASCLLTQTAQIYLANTLLERETHNINMPKQQFEKQTQITNIDVWTDPSQMSSLLANTDLVCKLQLKRSSVNHVHVCM